MIRNKKTAAYPRYRRCGSTCRIQLMASPGYPPTPQTPSLVIRRQSRKPITEVPPTVLDSIPLPPMQNGQDVGQFGVAVETCCFRDGLRGII